MLVEEASGGVNGGRSFVGVRLTAQGSLVHRQKDASGGSLFHKPTMPPFVGSRRVEEGLEDALDDENVRDPRGRLVSALVGEEGRDGKEYQEGTPTQDSLRRAEPK